VVAGGESGCGKREGKVSVGESGDEEWRGGRVAKGKKGEQGRSDVGGKGGGEG